MCEQRLNQCFGVEWYKLKMPPHPEVDHLTPVCLSSKGKQREEEGGVEYLGRNKAIGQKKNVTSMTAEPLETESSGNGQFGDL